MKYQMIVVGPLETNCYLVYDEETRDCLIVCPGVDDPAIPGLLILDKIAVGL